MIFMKTLKEFSAAEKSVDSEILLMQKFVDPDNLYDYDEETGRKKIKPVTEF